MSSERMPLIGVTSWANPDNTEFVRRTYTSSIYQCGGLPLMLARTTQEQAIEQILNGVDGLVFSGGNDVNPALYGGGDELAFSVEPERDEFELALLKGAFERKMPLFAICRGMQLINVMYGGTLHEDLATSEDDWVDHLILQEGGKRPHHNVFHDLQVSGTSLLYEIVRKSTLRVNTVHHQGIDKIGSGLDITAICEDGLIEALEVKGQPFALCVQWHPEILCCEGDEDSKKLFSAFIDAAQKYSEYK